MFICALRREDNTGKKARILMEYHQLESGLRTSILEKEFEGMGNLTETWVVKMIRKLGEESLRIKKKLWLPSRKGGQAIMERLTECGIRGEEWEKHNMCRTSL